MIDTSNSIEKIEKADRKFKGSMVIAILSLFFTLCLAAFYVIDTQARYQNDVKGVSEFRNKQLNQIESGTQRVENLLLCTIMNPSTPPTPSTQRAEIIKSCADEKDQS